MAVPDRVSKMNRKDALATAGIGLATAAIGNQLPQTSGRLFRLRHGAQTVAERNAGTAVTTSNDQRQKRKQRRTAPVAKFAAPQERRKTTGSAIGYGLGAAGAAGAGAGITALKWTDPRSHQQVADKVNRSAAQVRENARTMGRGKPTATYRALNTKTGRNPGGALIRASNVARKYPGRSAAAALGLKAVGVASGVKAYHRRQESQGMSHEMSARRFGKSDPVRGADYPNLRPLPDNGYIRLVRNPVNVAEQFASARLYDNAQGAVLTPRQRKKERGGPDSTGTFHVLQGRQFFYSPLGRGAVR